MVDRKKVSVKFIDNLRSDLLSEVVKNIETLADGPILLDPRILRGEEGRAFYYRSIWVTQPKRECIKYQVIDRPIDSPNGEIDSYEIEPGMEVVAREKGRFYSAIEKA